MAEGAMYPLEEFQSLRDFGRVIGRTDPQSFLFRWGEDGQTISSVAQVIEKMRSMRDPAVPQPWEPCGYRWHSHPEYGASRGRWLKKELA